jgi:hypothetical protein
VVTLASKGSFDAGSTWAKIETERKKAMKRLIEVEYFLME